MEIWGTDCDFPQSTNYAKLNYKNNIKYLNFTYARRINEVSYMNIDIPKWHYKTFNC